MVIHSSFTPVLLKNNFNESKPLSSGRFIALQFVEKLNSWKILLQSGKKCYFVLKQAIFLQTIENDRLYR